MKLKIKSIAALIVFGFVLFSGYVAPTRSHACINGNQSVHCIVSNWRGSGVVFAADPPDKKDAPAPTPAPTVAPPLPPPTVPKQEIIVEDYKPDCNAPDINTGNCAIVRDLLILINALSAIVGLVSVIMIAYWGIQYTVARDNPQATATARLRLLQTVIALASYLFMYAFLQYIVPGGVF